MGVKISALLPKARKVPTGEGTLEVFPLTLAQITKLIQDHRVEMMELLIISQSPDKNFMPLLGTAPDFIADVIALSARVDEPEERDAIKLLGAMVQLEAMSQIWEATLPDPKKLMSWLDNLTSEVQKVVGKLPKNLKSGTSKTEALAQKNAA
jgi:hypothetical protein